MVVEIAAARVLAPIMGVSLYSWTAIIGLAVPSLGLGMIVPPAVRLATRHAADSGRSVGTVYAAATAGNILGVFLTGFLLIDLIGSRLSVAAAGAAMLLVATAVGRLWAGWPGRLAFLALATPLALAPAVRSLAGPCSWERAYFCIQIVAE